MGLGFVLFVWTMGFGCTGLPVAGGLAYWSWRSGHRAHSPSIWRAVAAGLLPFILILCGLIWFFAYAAYSWSVRKVDPGLGDSWVVPFRNGYSFCMIDVTDYGTLMKEGCSGSPLVEGISELAEVGDVVVGSNGHSKAFVFDTLTGELRMHPNPATAIALFSPPPKLQTADSFYRSRRFGWQDLAAFLVLVGLVVAVSWLWFSRFIRGGRVSESS